MRLLLLDLQCLGEVGPGADEDLSDCQVLRSLQGAPGPLEQVLEVVSVSHPSRTHHNNSLVIYTEKGAVVTVIQGQ